MTRALFTTNFWVATAERAIKTFGQSAALAFTGQQVNLVSGDILVVLLAGVSGAVLSVLTSVGSAQVGDDHSPSLVDGV